VSFPGAQGGYGRPPLENMASSVLAAARGRHAAFAGRPQFPPAAVQKLTAEQQAEAIQTIASGGGCGLCGGIHAAQEYGCPRLSSFRLDGDGKIVEGTFWRDGEYDTSRVVFPDTATTGEDGDGT